MLIIWHGCISQEWGIDMKQSFIHVCKKMRVGCDKVIAACSDCSNYEKCEDVRTTGACNDICEKCDSRLVEKGFDARLFGLNDEAFFDCDIETRTMRYSKNFAEKIGVPEVLEDYPMSLIKLGIIASDSIELFNERFLNSMPGILEEELHFELPEGQDLWYLCYYSIFCDDDGKPVRAVGKLTDITKQYKRIEELSILAEKDQLTNLYNKVTMEHIIKEALKKRSSHDVQSALFIVDVDNFKSINDNFGHLYGDIVLTQLANLLKRPFREEDAIGRIGGDEFFVFIKNVRSAKIIEEKAAEICRLFCKTYREKNIVISISASIGIAICPDDGIEFDDLYKSADTALYTAKALGKNRYTFCDGKAGSQPRFTRTEIDAHGRSFQKSFMDNKIEYMFKLLYGSKDLVTSVQSILQLLTETFEFSRGYIFENSSDGKLTSNTFEWCVDDVTPEIDNLQNVPIEVVDTAMANFASSGMFILKSLDEIQPHERAVLEPQGIKSMFQFGIIDDGKPVGFIGFDDCVYEHVPTDAEIDEICTICHVIATFLLKERSAERERQQHLIVESVVNNLPCLAYVIDSGRYEVLYENDNVVQIVGTSSLGKKCHTSYRGSDTPCDDCPMAALSEKRSRYSAEVYNTKFDMHVRVDSAYIPWTEGRKACLLNSIDISEYKKKNN